MSDELPEHVRRNREDWDRAAPDWVGRGRDLWSAEEPVWGVWRVIALLRSSGFEIEELVEPRPPDGSTNVYHPNDALAWAQKWPCEEAWKVRRR